MVNTSLSIALLALLTSCAPRYTLQTSQGSKECAFPYGKQIKAGPGVEGAQNATFKIELNDHRRHSTAQAGVAQNTTTQSTGLSLGFQDTSVTIYTEGSLSLTIDSLSFSEHGVATPLLAWTGSKLTFASPITLPFYAYSKVQNALQNPPLAARDFLLRDTLPILPIYNAVFEFRRMFGIPNSPTPTNNDLLETIADQPTNPHQLLSIESLLGADPLLDGRLRVLHDELLLEQSILFWKRDPADLNNVYDKIKSHLEESLSHLEAITPEGLTSQTIPYYLSHLYHISQIFEFSITSRSQTACILDMDGPYLFLVDDSSARTLVSRAEAVLSNYTQKEIVTVNKELWKSFEEVSTTLDPQQFDPERFNQAYQKLSLIQHYIDRISRVFHTDRLRVYAALLTSRHPEQEPVVLQVPSFQEEPYDAQEVVLLLEGLHNLTRRKEPQSLSVCDIPDLALPQKPIDLRRVVNTYHALRTRLYDNTFRTENPEMYKIFSQASAIFKIELEKEFQSDRGSFEFYRSFSHKEYAQARSQFWQKARKLENETIETKIKLPKEENTTAIHNAYTTLLQTPNIDPQVLIELEDFLAQINLNTTYLNYMQSVPVQPQYCRDDPPL